MSSYDVVFTRPGSFCAITNSIWVDLDCAKERILISAYSIDDNLFIDIINESNAPIKKAILSAETNKNKQLLNIQDRKILGSKNPKIFMHHKFIIIDDAVWVGSFNYSRNAMSMNWENTIRIEDADVVEKYVVEFKRMFMFGNIFSDAIEKITVNRQDDIFAQRGCFFCSKNNPEGFCSNHTHLVCKECRQKVEDLIDHFELTVSQTQGNKFNIEGKCRDNSIVLSPQKDCSMCHTSCSPEEVHIYKPLGQDEKYVCINCLYDLCYS